MLLSEAISDDASTNKFLTTVISDEPSDSQAKDNIEIAQDELSGEGDESRSISQQNTKDATQTKDSGRHKNFISTVLSFISKG